MAFSQNSINLTQKTVTLVASNVTDGTIKKHWLKGRELDYIYYAVPTGDAIPSTKTVKNKGAFLFDKKGRGSEEAKISSTEAIDIYVYCNIESDEPANLAKIGKLVISI